MKQHDNRHEHPIRPNTQMDIASAYGYVACENRMYVPLPDSFFIQPSDSIQVSDAHALHTISHRVLELEKEAVRMCKNKLLDWN